MEARNGREGLTQVEKQLPDIILLDLMMPEMDGFEFMERLRKNEQWLEIPVVVVTAKDLTEEDHRRLNGDVVRILEKGGYRREELLREICRLLDDRVRIA